MTQSGTLSRLEAAPTIQKWKKLENENFQVNSQGMISPKQQQLVS